jgi:hypothetical protein
VSNEFCIHGYIPARCKIVDHADQLQDRAGQVLVDIDEFHEIDYDSCSSDGKAQAQVIARALAAESRLAVERLDGYLTHAPGTFEMPTCNLLNATVAAKDCSCGLDALLAELSQTP